MKIKLWTLIILILLTFCNSSSYASHGAGAELVYTWTSDSTYHFTYKLYRDCAGVIADANVTMCITNDCNPTAFSITLTRTANINGNRLNGTPIASTCPGFFTICTSAGGTLPGFEEWWYEGDFTIPYKCSKWTFATHISSRNSANNLLNSASTGLYSQATLNNVLAQGNSSAQYTIDPEPYMCINEPVSYNSGTVDMDGDSLGYEMIQPEDNTAGCGGQVSNIPFASGTPTYNLTSNPLPTNNTFVIDPITGQLTFTPKLIGNYSIAVRITEYRNHVAIGTTMRDLEMHVLSCSLVTPGIHLDSSTTTIVNNRIENCVGTAMHFCFTARSSNTAAVLIAADDHSLCAPGSTITYTGINTNSVQGCFSWTPTNSNTGYRLLTITIADSTCTTSGMTVPNRYGIPLYILPSTTVTPDTIICNGTALTLTADGGTNYNWSVLPGGASVSSLSCITCSAPVVAPPVTTSYVVVSNQVGGCQNTDTTTVSVIPMPSTPILFSNSPVCAGDTLRLTANTQMGSYKWSGPAGFNSVLQDPVIFNIAPANAGMYHLMVKDSNCYSAPDSLYVQVVNTQVHISVSGNYLVTADSFASYQWYLNGIAVSQGNSDSLLVNQNGTYYVVVTNNNGCVDSAAPFNFTWLGLKNLNGNVPLLLYPNPANSILYIDASMPVCADIIDIAGRCLMHLQKVKQVDISTLAAGIYMVKITEMDGRVMKTEKLVKMDH